MINHVHEPPGFHGVVACDLAESGAGGSCTGQTYRHARHCHKKRAFPRGNRVFGKVAMLLNPFSSLRIYWWMRGLTLLHMSIFPNVGVQWSCGTCQISPLLFVNICITFCKNHPPLCIPTFPHASCHCYMHPLWSCHLHVVRTSSIFPRFVEELRHSSKVFENDVPC